MEKNLPSLSLSQSMMKLFALFLRRDGDRSSEKKDGKREADRWLRSWRQRVMGSIVRRDITTPLQWRLVCHLSVTVHAHVLPATGPYVVCDGPRGYADFDFSMPRTILSAKTIHGLDGRYLAINRTPPPPSATTGHLWQYTSIAFPDAMVPTRAPWVLRIGASDDPDATVAVARALAGLVAWFALGGPVPAVPGAYPDVYALFRAGLLCPRAEADPLELIATVARVIGNEGVDYALRLALQTLLDDVTLPDVDAWFVGIEFYTPSIHRLLWLGGPVENNPCNGQSKPSMRIHRFIRRRQSGDKH